MEPSCASRSKRTALIELPLLVPPRAHSVAIPAEGGPLNSQGSLALPMAGCSRRGGCRPGPFRGLQRAGVTARAHSIDGCGLGWVKACGKPSCRYAEWTRKIGGKTVTRRLSPADLTEYQPLFGNAKKLRALLAELQDLTLEIIEADSRQEP